MKTFKRKFHFNTENEKTKFRITITLMLLSILLACACITVRFHEDRTPPQIYFSDDNLKYSETITNEELLADVSAKDNDSGNVSDTLRIEKIYSDDNGNVCVVYVAKDQSNNVAKRSRILSTIVASK